MGCCAPRYAIWFVDIDETNSLSSATELVERLGGSRNLIFEPFPYGYVNQPCRIAAMRRPRGWSTA